MNRHLKFITYAYDPVTGDLFTGKGAEVAVDLNEYDDRGTYVRTLWSDGGYISPNDAHYGAQTYAGMTLVWEAAKAAYRENTAYMTEAFVCI